MGPASQQAGPAPQASFLEAVVRLFLGILALAFTVGAVDRMDVTLNWPGSELELILQDPGGRQVTPGYPESRGRPRHLAIQHPLPGEWRVSVKGIEVTGAAEPFHLAASTRQGPPPTPLAAVALMVAILALGALAPWIRREAGLDSRMYH